MIKIVLSPSKDMGFWRDVSHSRAVALARVEQGIIEAARDEFIAHAYIALSLKKEESHAARIALEKFETFTGLVNDAST